METVSIYALPKTGPIRYIGMSADPKRRLRQHLRNKQNTHLGCWIRSLSESPGFRILKEVPVAEWEEWEMRYIRCAKALGFDLVNQTDGGEGTGAGERHPGFGRKHTAEARAKISEAGQRACSEETKEKISLAKKGKACSEIVKEKISAKLMGHEESEETRLKKSESARRAWARRKEKNAAS